MSRQQICCRNISYCPKGNIPTMFFAVGTFPVGQNCVGTFPVAQQEISRQLFLCRDISCWAILSGYFLLAQCRDISYWVCRDKYVPPQGASIISFMSLEFCLILLMTLGSQIGVPNGGVQNRGQQSGSQIGVPNGGPKLGSKMWCPKSRSQIRVQNRGPKWGSQIGVSRIEV
jgi:hypothetical protein